MFELLGNAVDAGRQDGSAASMGQPGDPPQLIRNFAFAAITVHFLEEVLVSNSATVYKKAGVLVVLSQKVAVRLALESANWRDSPA